MARFTPSVSISFRLVFLLIVSFKVAYWIILSIALNIWGDADFFYTLMWPKFIKPDYLSLFIAYDGAYYISISEGGYESGLRECAFYPLWPLLINSVSSLFGSNRIVTGLILANILSTVGWACLYTIVAKQWGEKIGIWSVVFMATFPGSLFFQFVYSESLFLVLVLLLWWTLQKNSLVYAFAVALLLPLTRAIGVFCLIPIFLHAVVSNGIIVPIRSQMFKHRDDLLQAKVIKSKQTWLVLIAPFLGWFCYLLLMSISTGNPFEGFKAQEFWEVHSIGNLLNIPKFIFNWLTPSAFHDYTGSLLDRGVFLLVVYCLLVLWKLEKSLISWVYVLAIIPAMSGMFTSFTRFMCVAFPVFIALSAYVTSKHPYIRYCILAIFIILHAFLVWRYANYQWAG